MKSIWGIRISLLVNIIGLGRGPKTLKQMEGNPVSGRKILIVGPGKIEIPPRGWGAIETIIDESIPTFQEQGFNVWLLNSLSVWKWLKARFMNFELVISYYDPLATRVIRNFQKSKIIGVCQYGYINYPNKWHPSYLKYFNSMTKFDCLVLMNNKMRETVQTIAPHAKLLISSNGTSFKPEIGRNNNGPYLSLGKVEVRKSQFELYQKFRKSNLEIKFIGQIADERVTNLILEKPELKNIFLGERSRSELRTEFKNYKALLLLSLGEADALVLYEAQMAGLPVFVTEEGAGAQDLELSWINLMNKDTTPETIESQTNAIKIPPEKIAEYAANNYSWTKKNAPLITEMWRLISR